MLCICESVADFNSMGLEGALTSHGFRPVCFPGLPLRALEANSASELQPSCLQVRPASGIAQDDLGIKLHSGWKAQEQLEPAQGRYSKNVHCFPILSFLEEKKKSMLCFCLDSFVTFCFNMILNIQSETMFPNAFSALFNFSFGFFIKNLKLSSFINSSFTADTQQGGGFYFCFSDNSRVPALPVISWTPVSKENVMNDTFGPLVELSLLPLQPVTKVESERISWPLCQHVVILTITAVQKRSPDQEDSKQEIQCHPIETRWRSSGPPWLHCVHKAAPLSR